MARLGDNFYLGTKDPLTGADAIQRVRQETDTCMVAFSYGKDSIGTYLAVKDHFPNVFVFHRQFIPGLKFVERRLAYYEQQLGIHIIRVTDTHLYRMLKNCLWQPPHRVNLIDAMQIPDVTYLDINNMLRDSFDIPDHAFVAVGVRAADSLQRRATYKSRGPINWNERMFWPIADLSHQGLADMIDDAGIQLPADYHIWGTSFDGLRYFFLKAIREHYPDDYATILEWFPFADMEFFRHELVGGSYEKQG